MIKITELSGGQEKSTLFSEDTLIIGDTQGEGATLPLAGRGLKSQHIRIFKQDGALWVLNLANDPFVTLNGHPFYKKQTHSGSLLRIRDIEFKIEEILSPENLPQESAVEPAPPAQATVESHDFHPEVDLQEIEEIIHTIPRSKDHQRDLPSSSLKDFDSMSDKEIENQEPHDPWGWTSSISMKPFKNVKFFSFFLMVFFLILSVVAVESYLRAGEKSDLEEIKAAESLSDIAMALTYAQFYHISPQRHNWSDPEFIQNNLLSTLPTGSCAEVVINSQGEFSGCHYILRVYTSNDLSRFLIVAHPTPTLFQWLIPKSAILVDSSSMELRRIRDLKALNRLLANLNTLDGINVSQVTELVKKGEIIPLSYMARSTKKPEFQPPRALAFLRPGAENLIYNAPRYHPFGDALLKKAGHFASSHTSSHELAMLQSELEVLKKLPNLILYTTGSPESARRAIAALKVIGSDKKFMLGSIKYDNNGKFRSTQIVMDLDQKETALPPQPEKKAVPYVKMPISFNLTPAPEALAENYFGTIPHEEVADSEESKKETDAELAPPEEDSVDPLKTQVKAISDEYKLDLSHIENDLLFATQRYLKNSNKKAFWKRVRKIDLRKTELKEHIKEEIFDLSFDLSPEDEAHFRDYLQEFDLEEIANEALSDKSP